MRSVEIANLRKEISDKRSIVGLKGVRQIALRRPEKIEVAGDAMVARPTLQGAVERANRQRDQRPSHEDETRQRRLRRPTDQDDG